MYFDFPITLQDVLTIESNVLLLNWRKSQHMVNPMSFGLRILKYFFLGQSFESALKNNIESNKRNGAVISSCDLHDHMVNGGYFDDFEFELEKNNYNH